MKDFYAEAAQRYLNSSEAQHGDFDVAYEEALLWDRIFHEVQASFYG